MKKRNHSPHPGSGRQNRRPIPVYFLLGLLLFTGTVMETTAFPFLSITPGIAPALVCAMGFLMDEKVGAIAGLSTGFVTALLGSDRLSFAPLFFMLCGYFCGRAVGAVVVKKYLGYLVCGAVAGIVKEGFLLLQYGLFSKDFGFFEICRTVLLPDYFAFLICIAAVYPIVYLIEKVR